MGVIIDKLRVSSFGCITDAEFRLTPLHALIGPNDSGKSTVLRALRTACQLAGGAFTQTKAGLAPFDPGFSSSRRSTLKIECTALGAGFETTIGHNVRLAEQVYRLSDGGTVRSLQEQNVQITSVGLGGLGANDEIIIKHFRPGSRMFRLDPDRLKEPSPLIPEGQPVNLDGDRGAGLAAVYDHLNNLGDGTFQEIVEDVKKLFPSVKHLGLYNVESGKKALRVTLTSGELVPAKFLSEGLLAYLAYAAAAQLAPVPLLLVEEPENGLHPARIAEVVRVLRGVSERGTQVVMSTHSPLVINELGGHEVSVLTRPPGEGTRSILLSETPHYAERSKVYQNGELWLSYSDGTAEAALLGDDP